MSIDASKAGSARVWGAGVKTLQTVDTHCAGEPARVVVGGLPPIPGATMVEKRRYCMENLDHIRKLLLLEPRGYPCQNADLVIPACDPRAAWGLLILEQNKIYPAMSGHNCICTVTAIVETGMVPMVEPVTEFALDTPAGLVQIRAQCSEGRCRSVTLRNVPSWLEKRDVVVTVPEELGIAGGRVTLDIAFGGMWYAIVDAASVGLELLPEHGKKICRLGEVIKVAAREQSPVNHPEYDYPGPDIIAFIAPGGGGCHGRNAVVMSNGVLKWDVPETWTGMIDRSPCGTGTCAVMAARHARGVQKVGEPFVHQSIVSTRFTGRLVEEVEVAGRRAVVPEITGSAWITQHCQVVVQPDDPFPEGYSVGDIWAA